MRRGVLIVLGAALGLCLAAAYGLVYLMATGNDAFVFMNGAQAVEIRYANILLWILFIIAPLVAGLILMFRLPKIIADRARTRRRDKGFEALQSALIANAAGDERAARREARRAENLLDVSAAPRVLAAQSAELAGDLVGAESAYAAMIADPRTELVGRRGLAAAAVSRRDFDTAIVHARQAFLTAPAARWAFDLLFDAETRSFKWDAAIETLSQGVRRKHVPDAVARRRRAVLLTASAQDLERTEPARARALAEEAAALSPAFSPGVAVAARLLVKAGMGRRAAGALEDAWSAAPHPALALAYRDLVVEETAEARAKRMERLAAANAEHRESAILRAEQHIALGEASAARNALAPVLQYEKERSSRIIGLLSRIAAADGHMEEARGLARQAETAPVEPDWSDLDPEGEAFAYAPEDWARLVYAYGDGAELIHPRHERYERPKLDAPVAALLTAPEPAPAAPPPRHPPLRPRPAIAHQPSAGPGATVVARSAIPTAPPAVATAAAAG